MVDAIEVLAIITITKEEKRKFTQIFICPKPYHL